MKETLGEFLKLDAVNSAEQEARDALESQMREIPSSWQYLAGMAEGINILVSMNASDMDIGTKACIRLIMFVVSKLGVEAIQEVEDNESFPEEL